MRIGICGKGGSGKTTVSSALAKRAAEQGINTWFFDCDVNQAGSDRFGVNKLHVPILSDQMVPLKEYLRGDNQRIESIEEMHKTTPPGKGSRLLRLSDSVDIIDSVSHRVSDNLRLFRSGTVDRESSGHRCHHYSVGSVELLLTHALDQRDDLLIVDMTAGIDVFSSPLFCYLDLIVVLVNPSSYSLDVLRDFGTIKPEAVGTEIAVILNRFDRDKNASPWKELLEGHTVIATIPEQSCFAEVEEKLLMNAIIGSEDDSLDFNPPAELTEQLDAVLRYLSKKNRDWDQLLSGVQTYHRVNCENWINAQAGKCLISQIDQDFRYQDYL